MRGSLTCCKILRYWANGFTSPLKEGVLQIFISLTNPSSRVGLNLQTGAMASTLIITPPRLLNVLNKK
jgi:hypothetical protein